MSVLDLNNNATTTFDYPTSEIKVNRSTFLGYNPNTSTISRRRINELVSETGVDDYVFNEIKKAKYQGCFDPGSLGNKNMFNDSYNNKITSIEITSNSNNTKKTLDKNKKNRQKTNPNLHRTEDGRNLLIAKTETQYPYKFDKRHYTLNKKMKFQRKKNLFEYDQSSSNISPNVKDRSLFNTINNRKISYKYNSFYNPNYNENRIRLDLDPDKFKNKTFVINKLMKNYKRNTGILGTLRSNKFTSSSNLLNHNNKNGLSPLLPTNRYSVYDSVNNYNLLNKKIYYSINESEPTDEDLNNLRYTSSLNKLTENNINYINNNTESIKNNLEKDINDEMKLINMYRKKLLSLFFVHMSNFYLLYFKDIYSYFLSHLKKSIKNKDYHFENKAITNLAEIKKKIKSNPYYYGHNKQYRNIIKDVKNQKNIILNKKYYIDAKTKINITKKYVETDLDNLKKEADNQKKNMIKERYLVNKKQNINKGNQVEDTHKNIKIQIVNKKYIRKKVTQRVLDKSKPDVNIKQKENNKKTDILSMDYFNRNENELKENEKLVRSFDENKYENNELIKIDKKDSKLTTTTYDFSKRLKKNKKVKPILFKKANVQNSFNVFNKNKSKNKQFINIKNNKFINKDLINKLAEEDNNSEEKMEPKIYDISGEISNDKKLNVNMKYIGMDNSNITPKNNKNNLNYNNYEIDKNCNYTIVGLISDEKDNNLKENEENDEIDTFSNKNIQNAISIITKIMENKENTEKKDELNSLLTKIIQKKIDNEEKQNKEILKKYFNLLKPNKLPFKQILLKKKKKLSLNLLDSIKPNKLFERPMVSSDNEDFIRHEKEINNINLINNKEDKTSISPNRGNSQFRVVIKKVKIHQSITKNILNPTIRKIKLSRKILPNFSTGNLLGKKFSKSVKKINKIFDDNNIDENENKEKEINKVKKKDIKKEEEKKEDKKSINSDELSDSSENNNLNINNEINKNDVVTNSDKNLHRNIKIFSKKRVGKDKRKSFAIPHLRSSIESFTKYIKKKSKFNKSNSDVIKEGDITLNEKYQDYENLIFYLRTQLIYCFIFNTKNYDSCAD